MALDPERSSDVNPLEEYFRSNEARLIHKWTHYFDIYHRHLQAYRGKPVTIVEFGVARAARSLMWRDYFGPKARLIGVDINPALQGWAAGTEMVIGDQEDREFLRSLRDELGRSTSSSRTAVTPGQQIATFEEFWPEHAPTAACC